jgi:serine/threonine-protein kinase
MAVGTPLYMSPEQAVGDQINPTSDLYSLACVLYEMLTGHPPFSGSNARQIMARHAMEQVPSIKVVRDTVPEEVEDAILAALNKVSADRPQTAAQFAELLGAPPGATASRYASPRITAARRTVTTPPGAVTLTLKRRSVLVGGIAAAVLLVLIAPTIWYLSGRATQAVVSGGGLDPHRVAVLYLEDLSSDKHLGFVADGLTEDLIDALSQVPTLKVVSAGGVGAWRDPTVPRDSVGRALQSGTIVQGTVEPAGDKLRVQLRLVDGNSGVDLSGQRASFDLPASDPLKVRDSLVGEASQLIRRRLGEEIKVREQREGTRDVAAWSLVQRAQTLRKRGEAAARTGDRVGLLRTFHEADSLALEAARMDPEWSEPLVLRALLAYRRSYHLGQIGDPATEGWIDSGLTRIGQAIVVAPNSPDALETRGNLRYWRWLLQLERDPAKAQTLLHDAQADFEQATRINPTQAGAWATLSHLYNQTKTGLDVSLAARRALESDAFLENADKVLQRIFLASYDLGQFTEADSRCQELARRYPLDPQSVRCRLWLLTTRIKEPDLALAWSLADSLTAMSPEEARPFERLYNNLLVASVLARASRAGGPGAVGLADSARNVIRRSKGDAIVDPQGDLALIAAFAYVQLGDKQQAIEEMKGYFAASPARREAFKSDDGWWFRDLQSDPAYQQLIGGVR